MVKMNVYGVVQVALVVLAMAILSRSGALTWLETAEATKLNIQNQASTTICAKYWVPNSGVGGNCYEVAPGHYWQVPVSPEWRAATVWAMRGGCGGQSCNTGPPSGVTQFEITVGGSYGNDYYDVSMLAGFNIGLRVSPSNPANPACTSQACTQPSPAVCQGFYPGSPDRTKACRYGSTDYNLVFSD